MEISNCHHENFEPIPGNVFCPACGEKVENITIANFATNDYLLSEMKCRHRIAIPLYPAEMSADQKSLFSVFFAHLSEDEQSAITAPCSLARMIVFVAPNHRNCPVNGAVKLYGVTREKYWITVVPVEDLAAALPSYRWDNWAEVNDPLEILVCSGFTYQARPLPLSHPITGTLQELMRAALEKHGFCYYAQEPAPGMTPSIGIGSVLFRLVKTHPLFRDTFAVFVPAPADLSPFSFELFRGEQSQMIHIDMTDFIAAFPQLNHPRIEEMIQKSGGLIPFFRAHEIYISYHLQKNSIRGN